MDAREALLQDLQTVKEQIERILRVTDQQVSIVNSFRNGEAQISSIQHISVDGKEAKKRMAEYIIFGALALSMAFAKEWGTLAFFAIGFALLLKKRRSNSMFMKAIRWMIRFEGVWYLAVMVWSVFSGDFGKALFAFVPLALAVALSFVAVQIMNKRIDKQNLKIAAQNQQIEKRNALIAEKNREIQAKYDLTVRRLKQLKQELNELGKGWYPGDYYSLEAVDFFIMAISNYKADNMKEAVQLFDDTQRAEEMAASQRELVRMQKETVLNQREMKKQMAVANVLSMGNIALQWGTMNAVNSNTSMLNDIKYQSYKNTNRIVDALTKR